MHYILGLTIEKGYLSINPCIPSNWKEYKICYKYGKSIYNIQVKNENEKNIGVETMLVNGQVVEDKRIYLKDDGRKNNIEVYM